MVKWGISNFRLSSDGAKSTGVGASSFGWICGAMMGHGSMPTSLAGQLQSQYPIFL